MLIKDVAKLSPVERLLYWIQERESIRLKKEAGKPWPWTDDTILSTYRFTNVRRMDDKVSKWLLENWLTPFKDHPNMLVAVAMARFFNLPNILGMIGFPKKWDPEKIKDKIRCHKWGGNVVFNAAYMVRGTDGEDKVASVIDYTVHPLFVDPPAINTHSMEETHAALKDRYGFGSFMAGQVVADLRWGLTGEWKDKKTWAPVGPGSSRGLCRLFGKPLRLVKQKVFEGQLAALIQILRKELSTSIADRLEAIDYQNCLCETDKYARVLLGEGRPKQLYKDRGGEWQ